jgi:hypothetical protein
VDRLARVPSQGPARKGQEVAHVELELEEDWRAFTTGRVSNASRHFPFDRFFVPLLLNARTRPQPLSGLETCGAAVAALDERISAFSGVVSKIDWASGVVAS